MLAILKDRLKFFHLNDLPLFEEGQWIFADELCKKDKELAPQGGCFFNPIVQEHLLLTIEYNVLCDQIDLKFNQFKSNQDELDKLNQPNAILEEDEDETDLIHANEVSNQIIFSQNHQTHHRLLAERERLMNQLKDQLHTALVLSSILAHVYRNYLNVPSEAERFERNQGIYLRALRISDPVDEPANDDVFNPPPTLTKYIRDIIVRLNWIRLFLFRSRRVLETLLAFITSAALHALNQILAAIFLHIAWIFYVPRLFINLFLFIKHTLSPWMLPNEENLSFWVQSDAQLQRRGFEMGNDLIWLIAGLLNRFTEILAPVAPYVPLVLAIYDALLAWWRQAVEVGRLEELLHHYADILDNKIQEDAPEELIAELCEYHDLLIGRLDFEKKRQSNNVNYMCALIAGVLLTLFTTPILPLLGTIWILGVTIIAHSRWSDVQEEGRAKFPNKDKAIRDAINNNFSFFCSPPTTPKKVSAHVDDKEAGTIFNYNPNARLLTSV